MTAREAAFVSLQKYETSGKYANIEADTAIRRNRLEGPDRALYTALFYGTVERKITLDYRIAQLSSRPIDEIDRNVRIILRMSLYQLIWMDRIPAYAVLQEAGDLCRRFAADSAVAFVNGILREWERRKVALPLPDEKTDYIRFLSVSYSYPEWICSLWSDTYGKAKARRIFEAFDQSPPLTLRVNTLKTTKEDLLKRLHDRSVGAGSTLFTQDGIRLTSHLPPEAVPGFEEGWFFVQDEASQLAVELLDPAEGERVLDACACPGGKSFSAAMRMRNRGSVTCFDLHANKLSLILSGAERLGLSILDVREQDGTAFDSSLERSFDRVLCDVPCSGLGVLSKKPDIRYKREDEIQRLPAIQRAILSVNARYVRPGGTLLYSTCTLHRKENEENIIDFLSEHSDFEPVPIEIPRKGIRKEDGMLTLFPDDFPGLDGFFVAKMRRIR